MGFPTKRSAMGEAGDLEKRSLHNKEEFLPELATQKMPMLSMNPPPTGPPTNPDEYNPGKLEAKGAGQYTSETQRIMLPKTHPFY